MLIHNLENDPELIEIVSSLNLQGIRCYYDFIEEHRPSTDDWRIRLNMSERNSLGFAAPGGLFTQAVYNFAQFGRLPERSVSFKNQLVIEIGAGCFHFGYALAELLEARAYIGVEPFFADHLIRNINQYASKRSIKRIPYTVVPEDILTFLRRIPDGLVSIFAFGIEKCILEDKHYRSNVEKEIFRVLHPEGGFLAASSDLNVSNLCTERFVIKRKSQQNKSLSDQGCLFYK